MQVRGRTALRGWSAWGTSNGTAQCTCRLLSSATNAIPDPQNNTAKAADTAPNKGNKLLIPFSTTHHPSSFSASRVSLTPKSPLSACLANSTSLSSVPVITTTVNGTIPSVAAAATQNPNSPVVHAEVASDPAETSAMNGFCARPASYVWRQMCRALEMGTLFSLTD